MLLARQAKMAPRKIAELIVARLYQAEPAVYVERWRLPARALSIFI